MENYGRKGKKTEKDRISNGDDGSAPRIWKELQAVYIIILSNLLLTIDAFQRLSSAKLQALYIIVLINCLLAIDRLQQFSLTQWKHLNNVYS